MRLGGRLALATGVVIAAAIVSFGVAEFIWWGALPPPAQWGNVARGCVAAETVLLAPAIVLIVMLATGRR